MESQVSFIVLNCYASAFRRRRHYVFGLSVRTSVRPSVRGKPEITSFHLYMGPLVHPTNHDRFAACPSVRPSVRRGFRAFAEKRMEGMVWNFACWCILGTYRTDRLWSWSVHFPPFGVNLTKWNGSNLGFPGISWRTHGGNSLQFCMLMYLDHRQNWLVYGHGLLIFFYFGDFFT